MKITFLSMLKINIPIGWYRIAFLHAYVRLISYPFRLQFKAASRLSFCISIYIISDRNNSCSAAADSRLGKCPERGLGWDDILAGSSLQGCVLPRPKLNLVIMMEGWPGMSAWVSLSPPHFRFFIVFSGPQRTFTFWGSSQLFRVSPIQQDVNMLSLQEITNLK